MNQWWQCQPMEKCLNQYCKIPGIRKCGLMKKSQLIRCQEDSALIRLCQKLCHFITLWIHLEARWEVHLLRSLLFLVEANQCFTISENKCTVLLQQDPMTRSDIMTTWTYSQETGTYRINRQCNSHYLELGFLLARNRAPLVSLVGTEWIADAFHRIPISVFTLKIRIWVYNDEKNWSINSNTKNIKRCKGF